MRGTIDTLLIAGGIGVAGALRDRALIEWIRGRAGLVRRLCSVCSGAFLLAEAGLLDGLRATTHWRQCERLAADYPAVSVETDPIFVRAGKIYTSAGVTAGIDLALALIEEDHGREVALAVARELVMFLRRPGGQSQFSVQLSAQQADREPIRDLQRWIGDNLGADLSVETLARRAAMSPRNFARVFTREVGATPGEFVENLRVEAAPAAAGRIRRWRRRDCVRVRLRHARVDAARVPPHTARAAERISQPIQSKVKCMTKKENAMRIAFLIFDNLTTLDAIGPFEVMCRIPGAEVMFVGETAGIKRADPPKSLGIVADYSIADVTSADILVVPGGRGEAQVREKPHMLEWVRQIDKTTQWTTSVCTGALVLGAAGLLKGRPATTHWARLEMLREFGAVPRSERVVEDGKIITAAGVSAGIDMGLHLVRRVAGDTVAHAIQVGIEYDPQPPFDGNAGRAPAYVIDVLRAAYDLSDEKPAAS